MTDVIMPQMGESIAEGTLTRWMKNVGDHVDRDEPLFEISTDKVDAEIPSPAAGILTEIRVQPGTTVPINTVVGIVSSGAEANAAVKAPVVSSAPPPSAPPPPAPPPAPADEMTKTLILPVPIEIAQPQAPPATSPRTDPIPAAVPTAREEAPARPRHEMTPEELRRTRSSPVVRRIASEFGVNVERIEGTGISGRVTKRDIMSHIENQASTATIRMPSPFADKHSTAQTHPPASTASTLPPSVPAPPPAAPPAAASAGTPIPAPASPAFQPGERVQVVAMSPIRKKTAEHMTASKRTSAHVTTVWEIDMTRVDQLRKKHSPAYESRHGVKLTFMPFVIKATIDALKAFPILNSSVEGDNIVYKKDVNIGMAVALDWGLIVPVLRNADEKNILGLARAVNDLAERARGKKLKVDEIQGGTFTITNPGVFGSLFGTPIINQPQVAILGLGTIEKRPVVRDDAIAVRTMTYLALTFDHRIVDGSDADRFMAFVKKELQDFDETGL